MKLGPEYSEQATLEISAFTGRLAVGLDRSLSGIERDLIAHAFHAGAMWGMEKKHDEMKRLLREKISKEIK